MTGSARQEDRYSWLGFRVAGRFIMTLLFTASPSLRFA
jgi:hypothetical protein